MFIKAPSSQRERVRDGNFRKPTIYYHDFTARPLRRAGGRARMMRLKFLRIYASDLEKKKRLSVSRVPHCPAGASPHALAGLPRKSTNTILLRAR